MHRHGWITALIAAALCACAGQTQPPSETGDAAPTPGPTCNDGGRVPSQHRPVAVACSEPAPPGNCNVTSSAFPGSCRTDSDCADAGPSGRCIHDDGPATCSCTYDQCTVDADCGSGHVCSCRSDPYEYGAGNMCVPGNCRIDSDCGMCGYCSPSMGWPSIYGIGGYYCHTAQDACIDDSDCGANGAYCVYSMDDGRWECESIPAPG